MKDILTNSPMLTAAIGLAGCFVLLGVGILVAGWWKKPRAPFVTCKKMPLCQLSDGHLGECGRKPYPDQW